MIQAKCIEKFRDSNGKIFGYRLIDLNGVTQDVEPENLKRAIYNKQVNVVNLTLTSDGRLVDTQEKGLKNEKVLGKSPIGDSDKTLGPWAKVFPIFQSKVRTLLGPMFYVVELEKCRVNLDSKGNVKLLAMVALSGNKPVIVMTPDEFYVTDINNSIKLTDEPSMKQYLMKEVNGFNSVKKENLDDLRKFVCNFAEQNNLGKVQWRRYDKSEDEDGFAIFISNFESDFKYKVLMDIAESGVDFSMDIKDTQFINYNRIKCGLNKKDIETLMKYLVKIVENKIVSSDILYICNGKVWDIV